jgi:hypothetical protein
LLIKSYNYHKWKWGAAFARYSPLYI